MRNYKTTEKINLKNQAHLNLYSKLLNLKKTLRQKTYDPVQ